MNLANNKQNVIFINKIIVAFAIASLFNLGACDTCCKIKVSKFSRLSIWNTNVLQNIFPLNIRFHRFWVE